LNLWVGMAGARIRLSSVPRIQSYAGACHRVGELLLYYYTTMLLYYNTTILLTPPTPNPQPRAYHRVCELLLRRGEEGRLAQRRHRLWRRQVRARGALGPAWLKAPAVDWEAPAFDWEASVIDWEAPVVNREVSWTRAVRREEPAWRLNA
jgi:hypothetical protein